MSEPEKNEQPRIYVRCPMCDEQYNIAYNRARCPHCGYREYDPDTELHREQPDYDVDEEASDEW